MKLIGTRRQTFRADLTYRLVFKKGYIAAAQDNVRNFKANCTPYALANPLFDNFLNQYRYCKFNRFSFNIKAFRYCYEKSTALSGIGATQVDVFPFRIGWDLDSLLTDNEEVPQSYMGFKNVMVGGGKKGVYLTYSVPKDVRKFIDSASVKKTAKELKMNIGDFLSQQTKEVNFRAPRIFRGGIYDWFNSDVFPTEDEKVLPVTLLLQMTCYANVSFRGLNTLNKE